jgi:hypothetical protein
MRIQIEDKSARIAPDPTLCIRDEIVERGQNAVCLVNRSSTSGQRDHVRLLRLGRLALSSNDRGYLRAPFF